MRFLLLQRRSIEDPGGDPTLARLRGELARGGVLLDGGALEPAATAEFARVGGVVEAYALLEVASRAEAEAWIRRGAVDPGALELREVLADGASERSALSGGAVS